MWAIRLHWARPSYKVVSRIFDFTPARLKAGCLLLHAEQRRSFPIVKVFGYSGFAIGVDRSHVAFRGFLSRKTTPRDLYETTVIAKPLQNLYLEYVSVRHRSNRSYRVKYNSRRRALFRNGSGFPSRSSWRP